MIYRDVLLAEFWLYRDHELVRDVTLFLQDTPDDYCRDRHNRSGTPAGPKGYNRQTFTNTLLKRAPEQL